MKKFLNQLMPFLFLGIAIVAFIFGIMLLAYLFLLGAIIGLTLYLIHWVRERFFPTKKVTVHRTKKNRVIDSDDWKHL